MNESGRLGGRGDWGGWWRNREDRGGDGGYWNGKIEGGEASREGYRLRGRKGGRTAEWTGASLRKREGRRGREQKLKA